MVRGVYWNIKFVSRPWWCIFSRCLTHVLCRVPLHQPSIMPSSWVWVEPRSARHKKQAGEKKKGTKCENFTSKHCYHCRVQAETSRPLPETLSRGTLRGIWSNIRSVVRYGWRPKTQLRLQNGSCGPLRRGSSPREVLCHGFPNMFFFLSLSLSSFLCFLVNLFLSGENKRHWVILPSGRHW